MTTASHSGAFHSAAMAPPSTMIDRAMPSSMPGMATPAMPSTPPTHMMSGNVTGSDQTARPPICAPQSPTENIARRWSGPEERMLEAAGKAAHRPLEDMGLQQARPGRKEDGAEAADGKGMGKQTVGTAAGRASCSHSQIALEGQEAGITRRAPRGNARPRRRGRAPAPGAACLSKARLLQEPHALGPVVVSAAVIGHCARRVAPRHQLGAPQVLDAVFEIGVRIEQSACRPAIAHGARGGGPDLHQAPVAAVAPSGHEAAFPPTTRRTRSAGTS